VQQDDERTRPFLHVMNSDAVGFDELVLKRARIVRSRVTPGSVISGLLAHRSSVAGQSAREPTLSFVSSFGPRLGGGCSLLDVPSTGLRLRFGRKEDGRDKSDEPEHGERRQRPAVRGVPRGDD
jgi:hypothetical protein